MRDVERGFEKERSDDDTAEKCVNWREIAMGRSCELDGEDQRATRREARIVLQAAALQRL